MFNSFVIGFLIFCLTSFNVFSQEIYFDSSNIDIKEDGNIIYAYNSNTDIPKKKLKIKSNKVEYIKSEKKIIFKENVFFYDAKNDIVIESEKVDYDQKKDIIYSYGETKIKVRNNYDIFSKNITFDRGEQIIFGKDETTINDKLSNIYKLEDKFKFNITKNILKSNKASLIDKNQNKYFFDDIIINLNNNELVGNELKVEFEKSYFGNSDNHPLMRGRSAISNDEELRVYNAVFSTCNIENKKCRGWELNTKEFNHDKKNKLFEYNNSWLKIFDYKAFYLPYFNHPDPSVKRKSGFLTPYYSSSELFGTSINIPYFKVLDVDKDLTFNPRYYADKSFLLQNEYRQALRSSNILSDFSIMIGNEGTKSHLFYNQVGNFNDNLNYNLNIQDVKGDNYLKNHKLIETSNLITDDSLLLSNFDLNWSFEDSALNTSFKVFEDLSRNYHDRYQYIFPDFSFRKNIGIPDNYNGSFSFNSYGYNKNYDTNIKESVITNDFLFKSIDLINRGGIVSNYNLLLKNSNNYSENSSNFEENANYDLYGKVKIDSSYPLKKKLKNHTHYLKPIVSLRYSPNGNSDLSSKDVMLNYNSVFDLNRIGSSYEVEGGESISFGMEFKRDNDKGDNIFDFKLANVFRFKENEFLPTKSKLNEKRSDIFGNAKFKLTDNLNLGYFFSYDKDLKYSNLEQLNLDFSVNNFFTNFSYYTEDNDFGSKENIKNFSSLNLNNENKISLELAKDLEKDYTQYYKLNYSFETDCISLNLNYNKTFYSDGNLEPNKSLSFLIKIIPFTELGVNNIEKVMGN